MGILNLFGARKGTEECRELASRGVAMYRISRFGEAIDLFDRALEIGGDIPEILYQRGMAHSRMGQLSDAMRDFYDTILAHAPSRLERDAWYNLGKANAELGELEESIGCYENAIRIDPAYSEAHCNVGGVRLRLGEKAADLGQYEQALHDLDRGLALDPDDALGYYNRATANAALKNDDRVNADLQKFLELAPPDHPYVPEITNRLAARGAPARSLEMRREREQEYMCQKIIEANDNRKFGEAIELCCQVLQKSPRLAAVWDEKAFALMSLGRSSDALACCDEGLALNPDGARLHNTRGLLLLEQKRHREALGSFEKYVALAPPEYADVVVKARAHVEEIRRLLNESARTD